MTGTTDELAEAIAASENLLNEDGTPKSAKQIDKEAKKVAKLQKLAQKIEKKSTAPAPNKDKADVIPPFNDAFAK